MSRGALTRLPDVVAIAQEEWDEVERRNQLLTRALAARNPCARFLFAERPLRPRDLREWRLPRLRQVERNVWVVRAIRPLPDRFRRAADAAEAWQVRRAARALGLERPLLWTQDPRTATIVDALGFDRLLFDLTDDWVAFEDDPARRALVQGWTESLGRRANLVLACSRALEAGARTWSERVRFVPNAVEAPSPVVATSALAELARPRLGYAGTLHSSRLDAALLARVAALRPAWSFVLMGPNQLEEEDRRRLRRPNIHYLGVLPHGRVRGYLEALDVGLIPHRVTEFTRSLDPLKLYEYLAAGLPVVATPAGNTPDLSAYVCEASTAEEVVRACEAAIAANGDEARAARRAAVASETWDARAAVVEAELGVDGAPPRVEGRPQVNVVIVSFNTRDLLDRCLAALHAQTGIEVEAIVVDNASQDGSAKLARERHPWANVIELDENVGFAGANNRAFEHCRGEYVLLLNSDAFLHDGALAELVAALQRNPQAGAVGPRLLNPDGTLQRSAWPFPTARRALLEAFALHRPLRRLGLLEDLGTWSHDEERRVDFLIGACLLVRRDALVECGGFDEEFWLYGEEADLQRRMAARGWNVVFTPRAVATHVGSASSGDSTGRLRHFYAGQMRFLRKHGSRWSWPLARIALLVGSLLRGRWSRVRVAIGAPR